MRGIGQQRFEQPDARRRPAVVNTRLLSPCSRIKETSSGAAPCSGKQNWSVESKVIITADVYGTFTDTNHWLNI